MADDAPHQRASVGPPHEPVMGAEVVELLGDRGTVLDMTVGAGGHAAELLEAGVDRVIGVDRDEQALGLAAERLARFGDRFRPVHRRFSQVGEAEAMGPLHGVLFDLGVSSMQLDDPERGFGYRVEGPLDMRMGQSGPTAADLVNELPESELADLLFQLGEERRSRRIARAIARERERAPITSTDQLTGIVVGAVGRRPGGPHPARRTFQALRIAVNRELEELAASLPRAVGLLGPGGRVVVLSYHSLEDRIVKRAFRDDDRLRILTKKPLRPSPEETARNPRSRSAKLRAAERVAEAA
ncbi:MAG TPA: 16S rRNA (cytosine(1402)-N(4))-methyltransferase RsmH [Actinomycetota bacterium]|nr:16S rRNA (cytosine(1402)-N(4))-methyltransferase RsmH [Actinomycetota bacterium]